MDTAPTSFTEDDFIPMAYWGRDHWSTLAYIDAVMVECSGFQVGRDARMKSNRRNFRVMGQECPKPKRPGDNVSMFAQPMEREHATKLNNGQQVANHDDWFCVQDMAAEGLFNQAPDDIQPGVVLSLSAKGVQTVNLLRDHQRNGGQLAQFRGIALSTEGVAG